MIFVHRVQALRALLLCAVAAASRLDGQIGTGDSVERIRRSNDQIARMADSEGDERISTLRELLRKRGLALADAALSNPETIRELALPPTQHAMALEVTGTSSELLEQTGEWTGDVEEQIEDDWENGRSYRRLFIRVEGRLIPLLADPGSTTRPRCGARVRVRGLRLGNAWIAGSTDDAEPRAAALTCAVTGEQRVAVILVNFPSTPLPAGVTVASMQTAFFGAGRSLDTYWREVSGGATWVTGGVFGPYTLPTNYTCDQFDSIRTAAIQAADPQVNFLQFNRIFLVVPNAGSCSIGRGTIGCSFLSSGDGSFTASTTWMRADYLTANDAIISVSAHEGGHNLGLDHAGSLDFGPVPLGSPGTEGTHSEYGNWYSVMGISWRIGLNYNIGHYAAIQKSQLGWLTSGSGYQEVTSTSSHSVLPSETGSFGTRALRVQRGPGSDKWLWIEYRRPEGLFDTNLASYSSNIYTGALVHYEDPTSPYADHARVLDFHASATPNNFNDAALQAGETWVDPYSLLRLSISSASVSALGVTVQFDSPCASLSPPTVGLSADAQQGSISVSAPGACSWTAVSNDPSWLHVTGGVSGSGNGTVSFSVDANTSGVMRTGKLIIQRQLVTITQSAAVPPGPVSLLSPSHQATDVALAPNLSWNTASNATSYDVHFGTTSPPPLFASGVGTTSHSPGTLVPLTRYYWRIVARNAYGSSQSSIRYFTTQTGSAAAQVGIHRSGFLCLLDANGNRQLEGAGPGLDYVFPMGGLPGDIPVVGDWNGDGRTETGFYRNGGWYLDLNGDRVFNANDIIRWFGGLAGDKPVVGDWNGDGRSDIGIFRHGFYWILDSNGNGQLDAGVDEAFPFGGLAGDVPLAGDWDGDGRTNIGIFRQGFLWILDTNGDHTITGADAVFGYGGIAGDVPITGDWNGDGRTEVGIFRQGFLWILDSDANRTTNPADSVFAIGGIAGDKPLVGVW